MQSMNLIVKHNRVVAVPISCTTPQTVESTLKSTLTSAQQAWLKTTGFEGKPGQFALVPNEQGTLAHVLVGQDPDALVWTLGQLAERLPSGEYVLQHVELEQERQLALGWALGTYRFDRYKSAKPCSAVLQVEASLIEEIVPLVKAAFSVRNLVNTPAEDMGPAELSEHIAKLARTYQAKTKEWVGDQLLEAGFNTIHAVGRASTRAPRLIELTWGHAEHPKVSLVGKGVCFDTGGLDMKPSGPMRLMKKDMGGAAHVIALAELIMHFKLPVQLKLLVGAVDNAISGNAIRPGDVVKTHCGKTVEIDNTDAEGRLVMGDALSYASKEQPDLLLNMATLTGAARVALGPDLPALFSNRQENATALLQHGQAQNDPLWQLPLYQPYRRYLDSDIADLKNSSGVAHAGAITAALYLEHMIDAHPCPWMHIDVYAWNDKTRPGRPAGGEALGLRALFAFLRAKYQ